MKRLSNLAAVLLVLAVGGCQKRAEKVEHGPAISAEQFAQEVEQATGVVLVDFWATWCAPCKMMIPVVDAAEQKFAGRLKVVRVDVDANQEIAQKYRIEAIPTYMLFSSGRVIETRAGAAGAENFNHWIETELDNAELEGH